jgi:hypothetical protein
VLDQMSVLLQAQFPGAVSSGWLAPEWSAMPGLQDWLGALVYRVTWERVAN